MWGFPASDRSCCNGLPVWALRVRGGLAAAWAEEKLRRPSGGWTMLLLCSSTILKRYDGGAGWLYTMIPTAAPAGYNQRTVCRTTPGRPHHRRSRREKGRSSPEARCRRDER